MHSSGPGVRQSVRTIAGRSTPGQKVMLKAPLVTTFVPLAVFPFIGTTVVGTNVKENVPATLDGVEVVNVSVPLPLVTAAACQTAVPAVRSAFMPRALSTGYVPTRFEPAKPKP